MNISPYIENFILHFGEMGNRWGINRTVGQIYALLFINQQALNAEEIAQILNFSRSNTSMGLKELQAWNLVKLKHLPNDRRDYFQAPEDIWQIFKTLAKERQKREIEPTLSMLRESLMEQVQTPADLYAQARMRKMHELIELTTNWFDDMQALDEQTLRQLMQMGKAAQGFLKIKNRLRLFTKSNENNNSTQQIDQIEESQEIQISKETSSNIINSEIKK